MGSTVRLATLIPDIMNVGTVVVVKYPLLVLSKVPYIIFILSFFSHCNVRKATALDLSLIYLIKLYAFSC